MKTSETCKTLTPWIEFLNFKTLCHSIKNIVICYLITTTLLNNLNFIPLTHAAQNSLSNITQSIKNFRKEREE